MDHPIHLERDEDGIFVASCPSLPGCVSQGQTQADAITSIQEAIEGYLLSLRKHGDSIPPRIQPSIE